MPSQSLGSSSVSAPLKRPRFSAFSQYVNVLAQKTSSYYKLFEVNPLTLYPPLFQARQVKKKNMVI
jgi:hypothetical protein